MQSQDIRYLWVRSPQKSIASVGGRIYLQTEGLLFLPNKDYKQALKDQTISK